MPRCRPSQMEGSAAASVVGRGLRSDRRAKPAATGAGGAKRKSICFAAAAEETNVLPRARARAVVFAPRKTRPADVFPPRGCTVRGRVSTGGGRTRLRPARMGEDGRQNEEWRMRKTERRKDGR